MPDLITLSNEVLYEIIEKIGPYHIEAFASTCQILRTLSSPAMQRHRQLRRRYSKIEFGNHGKLRGDHPIFTLRDILKDPEIAHYSHTLGIGVYLGEDDLDFDDGRERLKVSREEIQAVAHDCVDLFTAALSQCPFVEKQEIQTWTAALLAGEDGAAVGILLTLLPNLKTIQMEGEIFGELEALIERVADDYNGSSVTQTQALKSLRRCNSCLSMVHQNMGTNRLRRCSTRSDHSSPFRPYGLSPPRSCSHCATMSLSGLTKLEAPTSPS